MPVAIYPNSDSKILFLLSINANGFFEKQAVRAESHSAEEHKMKDEEFLSLAPEERLQVNEILRERLRGEKHNTLYLKGLWVTKKAAF